jgi:hypothetical protein
MITKELQAKIRKAYFVVQKVPRPSGKVDEYHVWHGYYNEGGQRHKVYIGKDLPDALKPFATKTSLRAAA